MQWLKSHICFFSGALNVSIQDRDSHCFYNNITLKQKANDKGKNVEITSLYCWNLQQLLFPFNIFIMYPAFFSENQIRYFHIFLLCFSLAETDVIKYTYSSPYLKKVVLLEWERSLWSGDKGPDCLFFSVKQPVLYIQQMWQ